jgi:hypothetical protein
MVPLLTIALLAPTCRIGAVVLLVIDPALVTVALLPRRTGPVIVAVESAVRPIPLPTLEKPVDAPVQVTTRPVESMVQSALAAVETNARLAALDRIAMR